MSHLLPSSKRLLLAAAIAITLPLAAIACPPGGGGQAGGPGMQMPPPPPPGMAGEMRLPFLHQIDLSQAQDDAVFNLMHAQAPELRRLRQQLQQARQALREMAFAPDYDEAAATKLTETIGTTESALARLRITAERQVYELLTPEQREQLQRDGDDFGRGGPDFGPGRGHRPGPGRGGDFGPANDFRRPMPPELSRYLELHAERGDA